MITRNLTYVGEKTGHILYFAAMIGHEEFFKEENISKFNEKNPDTLFGHTPLHFAARNGHLSICQLIIQNLKADDPDTDGILDFKTDNDLNPLWLAYYEGHENRLDICKLIIESMQNKLIMGKIKNNDGSTPYDMAYYCRFAKICKYFDSFLDKENPAKKQKYDN